MHYRESFDNRLILILFVILIAVLLFDIVLGRISDLLGIQSLHFLSLDYGNLIFLFATLLIVTHVIGTFILLPRVKRETKEISISIPSAEDSNHKQNAEKDDLPSSSIIKGHMVVTVVQYVLIGMSSILFFLMLLTSSYPTILLMYSMLISYSLAVVLLAILSLRFFTWFQSNRNRVILLYGMSAMALTIYLVFTATYMTTLLISKPAFVRPHLPTIWPGFIQGSVLGIMHTSYVVFGLISFILFWISTIFLMRHHAKKIGNTRYWFIVCIPLAYFLSQFTPLFVSEVAAPLIRADPITMGILLTSIFTISKPVGGILFGVAFWIMARSVKNVKALKNYMIMSALGIVLLFVSLEGRIETSSYPPFGLVTLSFVGISTYMMFAGLYFAAISVSADIKLRQYIRQQVLTDARMLESIGTAQMENEMTKKTMKIRKDLSKFIMKDLGTQPSYDESDIHEYLNYVLEEVTSIKQKKDLG